MEEVNVVRQALLKTAGKHPRGAVFSNNGELLLLENEFRRILVLRLASWTEEFRVVLSQVNCEAIWYMPSRDGILVLQSDSDTSELSFQLFLNWRTADPKTPKCSVAPAPARPNNWRFEPSGSGFLAFTLGSFRAGSRPSAAIHESAIVLVSESAAIFWDIVDRPVLRFLLCLPPPPIRPIFSFLGSRFAIVTQGTVLIVHAVAGPRGRSDEAFSPGSKCFELHETLVPWFGVTQDSINASSLFIVRHLPNRPVSIEILFEW
jgi:hypothetical protein